MHLLPHEKCLMRLNRHTALPLLLMALLAHPMVAWAQAQTLAHEWTHRPASVLLSASLALVVVVMMVYGARQCFYSLNRVFGAHRYPYAGIDLAHWPQVTVFVAAHNEEKVIASNLTALLASDYPQDRMKIVVVNDRSSDQTSAIVDAYDMAWPGRIEAFHRTQGKAGKAAALKDAMSRAAGDIAIIFDADYTPGPALIRQLTAPFFDPEVGAVMGRVVPRNVGKNLLTRLLDMERSAGYQVDQQARMNLRAVPQYGGTVGGVRLSAVQAVGGWHDDVLAEDTDITFRLLIAGWKTVYNNDAACHEEVPEEWAVRLRQVHRWAKGHNQVLMRQAWALLRSPYVTARERLDGLLLLNIFLMPPLLLMGWLLVMALYFLDASETLTLFIPAPVLMGYAVMGGFAAFLQMAYAVLVDGHRDRIRLLPIQLLNFMGSLPVISTALASCVKDSVTGQELVWHKTVRYQAQVAP
jgi:cellulose synthase/poly-beta-1,6-N-acetylglucosamine synthase-like glycosyltransferase